MSTHYDKLNALNRTDSFYDHQNDFIDDPVRDGIVRSSKHAKLKSDQTK